MRQEKEGSAGDRLLATSNSVGQHRWMNTAQVAPTLPTTHDWNTEQLVKEMTRWTDKCGIETITIFTFQWVSRLMNPTPISI